MEDIKKRLEFKNTAVKVQAVSKLLDIVIKKAEESKKGSSDKHVQSPAEALLFDKCTDQDHVVSASCCKAVLHLVRNDVIQFNDALRCLINLTPTARNINSISAAICDMLTLELVALVETSGSYICPYNIRDPTHPLITVVASRPDSWTALEIQLSRLFAAKDERISCHLGAMIQPLIQYILLEPNQTVQFLPMRISLVTSLIQAASGSDVWRVYRMLVDVLTNCQTKTSQNLSEVSHHLTCLMHSVTMTQPMTSDLTDESSPFRQETVEIIVVTVLEFCTQASRQSTDISHLLELVLKLGEFSPQCLASDVCFVYMIQLLPVLTGSVLITCMRLAIIWLNHYHGSNDVLVAMVMLPILNVISTPAVAKETGSSHQQLATKVFSLARDLIQSIVNGCQEKDISQDVLDLQPNFPVLSTERFVNQGFVLLARVFTRSRDKAYYWLSSNQSVSSFPDQVPYQMTCLVTSLLIGSNDSKIVSSSLSVLEKIVKHDEAQSPSMLPLLLYKINHVTDPDCKMMVLQSIPNMVTHKLAVAPVLRSLQILGNNASLKSVAMTLMSSLWKLQDRCFPYLQQLVLDRTHSSGTCCRHVDEVTTAQAACIKDICSLRPHQHGADVLPALSHIITHSTSDSQSPAVALVLDALFTLCQTEVIDIQTAWSVLAPILSSERRPLVVAGTCHLLSLVPELEVNTKQYEQFKHSILELLWRYTESPVTSISGSAFRALAKFSNDNFIPSLLPEKIAALIPAITGATAEGDTENPPEVIPGYCYVQLLNILDPDVYQDYQLFLTSLVRQEVAQLPKNRPKPSSSLRDTSRHQNKATVTIPTLLQVEFERNKTPGLRGSLSVGVLITYDLPVSTDRHGNPKPQQVIQRGRHYQQMLYSLIHEVPVQAGDWHRNLCLPEAWSTFMERCYHGYMEGHQMELSQQLERGQATDPDDIVYRQKTAWLWARDKLTDLIKSVSSGSPVTQANCLCALSALAIAVSKHVSSLDNNDLQLEGDAEYASHTIWINVVIETFLCILDHNHVARLSILNICQLQKGERRPPCSVLAQCGAGIALSMMVPIMVSTNADNIYLVLTTLSGNLPGMCQQTEQHQLIFYHSLSLGRVLGRLFEEHFMETAGAEGMVAVWKALSDLETSCLADVSHRVGAFLGLSICLVAMCSDINIGNRIHTCTIQEKLLVSMETMSQTDNSFETLCLCLAVVAGTGYVNNILTQDIVDQVVAKLYHIQSSNNQTPGIALALGFVCHLLLIANHPTVTDLTMKLFGSWINALTDEELPTLQRVSSLKGTMALAGSEDFIYGISSVTSSQSGVSIPDLVKANQHIINHDGDVGLQSSCAWQLGQLWMATAAAGASQASAPLTYHHLADVSIIRALVDVLIDAGKHGPDKVPEHQLLVILRSLVAGSSHPLPPLNWAGVLSPILRMTYGAQVECAGLQLAIQQSIASPNASLLITSWALPPIWHTLQHPTQLMMLEKLPTLTKTMQFSKLKEFLEGDFIRPFVQLQMGDAHNTKLAMELRLGAMRGLEAALRVPDPPQMIKMLLHQTVQTVYDMMPKELDVALYTLMCRCITQLPDDVIDLITSKDFTDLDLYKKCMFTRCYLVAIGHQPLAWLNSGIEAYMCKTESNPLECLLSLVHCFHGVYINDCKSCSVTSCQTWLLELMGHIKNIAMKMIPVVDLEIHQVLEFLLLVFSAAVCSWSGCAPAQLQLSPINLATVTEQHSPNVLCNSLLEGQGHSALKSLLRCNLAPSLVVLCNKEAWLQMTSKIIDWFLVLYSSPGLEGQPKLKHWIKGCLCALKHTKDFRKLAVWGRVFSL